MNEKEVTVARLVRHFKDLTNYQELADHAFMTEGELGDLTRAYLALEARCAALEQYERALFESEG